MALRALVALALVAVPTAVALEQTVEVDGRAIRLYPAVLDTDPGLPSPSTTANGTEVVVGRTADGRWTVLDVTVENGEGYVYGRGGKGRQLEVDGDDFPTLAVTGLHDEVELDRTRTVTRRSTAHITEIGRPGMSSGAGFMAADEDLISVLRGDNRRVCSLGLTHPALARPLFHVWNAILGQLEAIRAEGGGWGDVVAVRYHGHEVGVRWSTTRGWQESIFDDEILGGCHIEISRSLDDAERAFLEAAYPEAATGVIDLLTRVHVGEIAPFYVMRYGFYEGHTDYRAEPLALALIFGLKTVEELEEAFPGRLPGVLTTRFTREEVAGGAG